MAQQASVAEMSARCEEATANRKVSNSELAGVPHPLAEAAIQAGLQPSTGTIAFAGQTVSTGYSVQYNNQDGGFSSSWPQWAFELAKAALLANKRVWVASNGDPFGSNLVFVHILA